MMRLWLARKGLKLLIIVLTMGSACIAKGQDTITTGMHPMKGVLSVYPDLPSGNIYIKWENQPKGIANVVILDTADKEVLTTAIKLNTPSGQTIVDITALKQGEYTITITSEKISFTGKLSVLP